MNSWSWSVQVAAAVTLRSRLSLSKVLQNWPVFLTWNRVQPVPNPSFDFRQSGGLEFGMHLPRTEGIYSCTLANKSRAELLKPQKRFDVSVFFFLPFNLIAALIFLKKKKKKSGVPAIQMCFFFSFPSPFSPSTTWVTQTLSVPLAHMLCTRVVGCFFWFFFSLSFWSES